jgi:hypothetical protein
MVIIVLIFGLSAKASPKFKFSVNLKTIILLFGISDT